MREQKRDVLYSEEALKDIKKEGLTWWIIHSNEHPSGRKHIGYIVKTGCDNQNYMKEKEVKNGNKTRRD